MLSFDYLIISTFAGNMPNPGFRPSGFWQGGFRYTLFIPASGVWETGRFIVPGIRRTP